MDRLYRWKTHVYSQEGKHNTISHIEVGDSLPIKIDAVCLYRATCRTKATHIGGYFGKEMYLCGSCCDRYIVEHIAKPRSTWYCLTFEEIARLDNRFISNMLPFSQQDAEDVYRLNSYIYSRAVAASGNSAIIFLVVIDSMTATTSFNILNTREYMKEYDDGKLTSDDIDREWKDGRCLVLFGEPKGRVVYRVFLNQPSGSPKR